MPYAMRLMGICAHCGEQAAAGALYCAQHGGWPALVSPWYERIQAVPSEAGLASVCEALHAAGIVLDDWPGLARAVRGKRNRLKLDTAKARRAA